MSLNLLIFVRHGETQWNVEKRFQGANTDVPLSRIGELQSRLLANALLREKIAIVLSSPLNRARKTAEMIAEVNKVPVQIVEELRELSFGEYEGKLESELLEMFGDEFRKWRDSNYTLTPPGGESLKDAAPRARAVLELAKSYLPSGSVVICAHQGINMAIKAFICEDYSVESAAKYRQPNNRIDYFSIEERREIRSSTVFGSFAGMVPVRSAV